MRSVCITVVCLLSFGFLKPTPSAAEHRWSDNRLHLDVDSAHGKFTFKDQDYFLGEVPQVVDARALFKEGWLLPEFTNCEITTHQAVQKPGQILLLETTYYFKTKTPLGCHMISAPEKGGALVRFEHTVFSSEGDKLKMRRFVADAWEKPFELSLSDLRNPNLLSENQTAIDLLKNGLPPWETLEESIFELRRHSL